MFPIAAETGWSEDRILFMPLARLTQYQHCMFRRNDIRTTWSVPTGECEGESAAEEFARKRDAWRKLVDANNEVE